MDPRHQKRIKTIQNLFAYSFNKNTINLPETKDELTKAIIKKVNQIDNIINKYADKYRVDKILKTDLAILRWGVYELVYKKSLPPKVVIDEAVELAKELSGEKSFAFVNAILGKVIKSI